MVRPPYPAVVRLCLLASERWGEIAAAYHASPVPLLRLKPHMYLNYVYTWALERVPPDKVDDWNAELVDLLPWQDSQSLAAEEIESASFYAMMSRQQQ